MAITTVMQNVVVEFLVFFAERGIEIGIGLLNVSVLVSCILLPGFEKNMMPWTAQGRINVSQRLPSHTQALCQMNTKDDES